MPDHAARRTAATWLLPADVDALLVTSTVNVRYLTGFTGSNAALLVRRDGSPLFATDGRYVTQAAAEVPDVETVVGRSVAAELVDRAVSAATGRVGIESADVTISNQRQLLEVAGGQVQLEPLPPVVEQLRAVKDLTEVALLERACAITDEAFAAALPTLRGDVSELDVAWTIHTAMREHGAEGPAFDSIVAFGEHSAVPHHQPTGRTLRRGDLVKLDIGARYAGYHADMTRTVVVGPPAAWQQEIHDLVRTVQASGREALRPGTVAADLQRRAESRLADAGHPLPHGLGHGVGLEIHESPFLSVAAGYGAVEPGVVVTVEPGVYLPGRGGVRVEDTLVVTEQGSRSLTRSPRDLLVV